MPEIEFCFVSSAQKEITYDDLYKADLMIATFHCECSEFLSFKKPYEPVPLHYESLLQKCKDVSCKSCGNTYEHVQEEGLDYAKKMQIKSHEKTKNILPQVPALVSESIFNLFAIFYNRI